MKSGKDRKEAETEKAYRKVKIKAAERMKDLETQNRQEASYENNRTLYRKTNQR